MAKKSIQGSRDLSKKIKDRRIELNLTIEEAAKKANVGTKTWCRYEAGESIREDKYKGLCRALSWKSLPTDGEDHPYNLNTYVAKENWSKKLEEDWGKEAAASIAIGSSILCDDIENELSELSKMPKGTHVGQLYVSMLECYLPSQFLMQYDYDFVYQFYCTVKKIQAYANANQDYEPCNVMEKLTMYIMVQESIDLLELDNPQLDEGWDEWIFDMFDDGDDLIEYLYNDIYLTDDDEYSFKHWMDE